MRKFSQNVKIYVWLSLLLFSPLAQAQVSYSPSEDAYVHSSNPTSNYGSNTSVVTKIASDSRYVFFKFDLTNLTSTISNATLRLNVKSVSSNTSRHVYAVSSDTWEEGTITWNNKPALGSVIASENIGTSDDEQYIEWDITSYVSSELNGDGVITIAVNDANADGSGVDFYTKENSEKVPMLTISVSDGGFSHPGGLFTQEDLDRMHDYVDAALEPHYTSFQELSGEDKASYDYTVRGNSSLTQVVRGGTNGGSWESDATAAYLNALMWVITEDTRHADKCVEIFNAWKNITYVGGTGTYPLNAGLFVWKMVEAAEIIKSTYDGWSLSDIQEFQAMLVYPGYSDAAVPASVNTSTVGSFYWRIYNGDPGRHGNQDMIAYRGMITMAVFLDNEKMYDRALRYFTSQSGRTDDIDMPDGNSPSGSQTADNAYFTTYQYQGSQGTTPDYGYNGQLQYYFWENGQCQEASRDQEHVILGLGMAAMIARVAYNQGDDIWDMFDNRLLEGFEYGTRYNASYIKSYPDQTSSWEPTYANGDFIRRKDRTGRWYSKEINPYFESNFTTLSRGNFPGKRPIYELALAQFELVGQADDAKWTRRARNLAIDQEGYEATGYSLDSPGWGALCFRRSVNIPATHDSYVHSSNPNTNYGSNSSAVTKIASDTRYAYFKFDLRNYSGTVNKAILRLNVKSISGSTSRSVYAISDDSWTDASITWNNKPALGSELATVDIIASDDEYYVEWDITSYVAAQHSSNSVISIAINDPNADATGVDFYTREQAGTKVPILETEFSISPASRSISNDVSLEKAEKSSSDFQVYPNPARNHISIHLKTLEPNTYVRIYNISGDEILKQEISNNSSQLNISEFSSGVYLMEIVDEHTIIESTKFIKE